MPTKMMYCTATVSSGSTGHTESVQITYDPSVTSYATLLEVYWRQINPTDAGGQFADRGRQYRPGIFYHNAEQKRLAKEQLQMRPATPAITQYVTLKGVAATHPETAP